MVWFIYYIYIKMKIRVNQLMPGRSHRSLTRTENSLQKIQQRRQNQRIKTSTGHQNSSPSPYKKTPDKIGEIRRLKIELEQSQKKSRAKSGRTAFGIFRKAHEIKQNQSFLHKMPQQRVKILTNKQIRSIFKAQNSQRMHTLTSADNTSPKYRPFDQRQIKNGMKVNYSNSLLSPDIKFKTISYGSYSKTYTPQELLLSRDVNEPSSQSKIKKQVRIETEHRQIVQSVQKQRPIQSQSNLNQLAPLMTNIEAAPIISQQRQTQSMTPTVKKQFRNYKKEIPSVPSSQTTHKQTNKQQFSSDLKPQNDDKKSTNTIARHYDPSSINLDNLQTIEPIQRLQRVQTIQKVQRAEIAQKAQNQSSSKKQKKQDRKRGSSKKQYYNTIYNQVNEVDIEQIALISSFNDNKKQKIDEKIEKSKKKGDDKPKDWNTQLQRAKQQNNPYLPIQSNKKIIPPNDDSNIQKIKQKNNNKSKSQEMQAQTRKQNNSKQESQQIQQVKLNQRKKSTTQVESQDSQTKQKINKLSKVSTQQSTPPLVKKPSQKIKPKQPQRKRSQTLDPKTCQKQKEKDQKIRMIQALNKIAKMHTKLELLGELATYFSKNSKSFKRSQQNKDYIRNQCISWHFMVYLFFKYFYYMLLLFSKYYQFSAVVIPIKKSQLDELNEENTKWQQTLQKIQKSVKKNMKAQQYQEKYFENPRALLDLQSRQKVNDLIQLYILRSKDNVINNFSEYMATLSSKIFKQVTTFIKSFNLANILKRDDRISRVFQVSAFRIFNSTIIIYQMLYIPSSSESHITTCESIEQLDNPPLQKFKDYYQKLTKEILIKK